MSQEIPVVILCGGRGLRMSANDEALPKPLVEVGGRPILWHVMALYASQGFRSFVLCLGWNGERIESEIASMEGIEVVQRPPGPSEEGPQGERWRVSFVDTGLETPTGGRVARVSDLIGGGTFFLTYSDGLADIQLDALLDFHRSHGGAATVTVVRPRSPWGVVELEGDGRVRGFREKPRLESWVNGGFFVMEPRALDHIGPDDVLERAPMESLTRAGELRAYRHEGFWECMDTYKDSLHLNELWERNEAPWNPPLRLR